MSWSIHPIRDFPAHSEAWDTLAQGRVGAPFLRSGFIQPAITAFGRGDELLCLYQAEGQLRIAMILSKQGKGMWQTFQPSQLPLGAFLSDGSVDIELAAPGLWHKLPGLCLGLGLTQLDPNFDPRPTDSIKRRSKDYIQTSWVDINGSFDAYWDARGKNLKQNTRKQRNKLQSEGVEPRLECLQAVAEMGTAIEQYGRLESAGWKTADGTAINPENQQGRFYRKMLENFAARGQARVYRYWFGDKVVAMDLCIDDGHVIVILKTTYDESYKAVSPSTLMRQTEFQQLFDEQKFRRIEFYGKVMEWHTRWTEQLREIYHCNLYRFQAVLNLITLRNKLAKQESTQ
ncbi:GNAT family N-acetyltransferase [Paucibacter sp. KCTC 42545]|uniref:GNAT family N-acetyltransferase n=1 Tax=Paucibacter sp. KCTC 42545 TaxID=1768242 RepID=UPI000733BEC9|nr:GNAT family N-acetyltransferase [Paucibacter sp. KCTC 42545]ALT77267.1 hypothetical protein AT984_08745 [Paucibacter sp. KCTC 42545]